MRPAVQQLAPNSIARRNARIYQLVEILCQHTYCANSYYYTYEDSNLPWCYTCVNILDHKVVRDCFSRHIRHETHLSREPPKSKCSHCHRQIISTGPGENCRECEETCLEYLGDLPSEQLTAFYNEDHFPGLIGAINHEVVTSDSDDSSDESSDNKPLR